ncbi:Peroxisomal hydratase-dehydrogenase-epimerase [Zancudomyces culisetae]|uniref:Peroxisomal hydratase-dehydrogenase-epimerase n=1 Tax=Zancudomyces culisetae TaxID=1213189 RepID=A0A1R1PNS9_ZANCU|nr:Peroxisomal hydratase-dehydrogenase-epimerase [Zancudomyces culisetae]|eukprot:OMH82610.1 Peroxisomal hydratase-dehydrogenase-epimerase [Zancudomyces culisetae]
MADQLRFDGRVAVVTGAGNGLGRVYALYYGSRGASVVVNDIGSVDPTNPNSKKAADVVVEQIVSAGGKAVANYDSVENGERVIETAMRAFGRVDILINNAGILRDKTFVKMTDKEWDQIVAVHLTGAYYITRAAWPIFRKQGYGRIIMTTSPAGIYGNFGQVNYSAAKHALIGFSNTLAQEGAKYNITSNAIAPLAASGLTASTFSKEMSAQLDPKFVLPVVAYLTHESTKDTGMLVEEAGGFVSAVRWELSQGAVFKSDSTLTPAAVKARYNEITQFNTGATYPTPRNGVNYLKFMEDSNKIASNPQGEELRYDGQVIIVTGAGAGLGRTYALMFARYGGKVVVNDVGSAKDGSRSADKVVAEIKSAGGQAVADYNSVENGEAVVGTALKAFGRVDILINNAGILRDKSFINMTHKQWEDVYKVHLYGSYKMTKAVWPLFIQQKSGAVINTSSSVGIYGNFGQANYSSCKAAMIGFTFSLALEGAKHNIRVNCIAPNAGTAMTATVMPPEIVEMLKPEYVAPFVGYLVHNSNKDSGKLFQVGSCWMGQVRRQCTGGHMFTPDDTFTPEAVRDMWPTITNFDDGRAHFVGSVPARTKEILTTILKKKFGPNFKLPAQNVKAPKQVSVDVEAARADVGETKEFKYTERDVMLYAVGIGASRHDLNIVYENSPDFQVFPTYPVIPAFFVKSTFQKHLPKFHPMMLLHGEQFVQIHKPLPTSGTLLCTPELVDIADKGSGAAVVSRLVMKDTSGNLIAEAESTAFIRGIGGFSKAPGFKKPSPPKRNPVATAVVAAPKRTPDAVVAQQIGPNQAAIYRLSGDYNPLHIDPEMAAMGKFDQPILHGLCSMGHAARHVVNTMAQKDGRKLKAIKVRFSSPVFPGETIETSMWIDSANPKVVLFNARVIERNVQVIANGIAEFSEPAKVSASQNSKL